MKNILILGSQGLLSRNLIAFLSPKYNIYEVSSKRFLRKSKNKVTLSLSSKKLDLNKLNNFFQIKFNAIIFLSNLRNTEFSNKQINLIKNTIKLISFLNYNKFINFSSTSVYQKNLNIKYSEDSKLSPISNSDFDYSLSKIFNEFYFFNYFEKIGIEKFINLRIGQIFGKSSSNKSILNKLNCDSSNEIYIFGSGERTLNYVVESDLQKLILKILNKKTCHLNLNIVTDSDKLINIINKNFKKKNTKLIFMPEQQESNERCIINNKNYKNV